MFVGEARPRDVEAPFHAEYYTLSPASASIACIAATANGVWADGRRHPWRRICRVIGGSITSGVMTASFDFAAVWRRMIHICTIEKRFERNQYSDRADGKE